MEEKNKKNKEARSSETKTQKTAVISKEAYEQLNVLAFQQSFKTLIGHFKRDVINVG